MSAFLNAIKEMIIFLKDGSSYKFEKIERFSGFNNAICVLDWEGSLYIYPMASISYIKCYCEKEEDDAGTN